MWSATTARPCAPADIAASTRTRSVKYRSISVLAENARYSECIRESPSLSGNLDTNVNQLKIDALAKKNPKGRRAHTDTELERQPTTIQRLCQRCCPSGHVDERQIIGGFTRQTDILNTT